MDFSVAGEVWTQVIDWLIVRSPDWLDPYIEFIAATILILSALATVFGPLVSVTRRSFRLWRDFKYQRALKYLAQKVTDQDAAATQLIDIFENDIVPLAPGQEAAKYHAFMEIVMTHRQTKEADRDDTSVTVNQWTDPSVIEDAQKAFTEFSQSADNKEREALHALIRGRADEAAALITEAAEAYPSDAPTRLRRFATIAQPVDPNLALDVFAAAAKLDPDHAGTHYMLAIAYRSKAKLVSSKAQSDPLYEQAAEQFRAAADLADESSRTLRAEALTYLGRTLRKLGRRDEAIAIHEQAIALKKEHAIRAKLSVNYHDIGVILMQSGQFEAALEPITLAASHSQNRIHFQNKSILGVLHRRLGNLKQARTHHEAVLRSVYGRKGGPLACSELNNIGIVHRLVGKFDASLDCHTRALSIAAKDVDRMVSMNCLADLALERGDPVEAERLLEEILAQADPQDARTMKGAQDKLGILARLNGDLEKSETIHENSLKEATDTRPIVLLNLSWALAEQGKSGEVLKYVMEARGAFEESGQKLEIAECREVQALSLFAKNHSKGAVKHLHAAARGYRSCGAWARQKRVSKKLKARSGMETPSAVARAAGPLKSESSTT
ncbi:MAG: tetratricopeptide repeat protein [Pseudomonadota bacterium]